MDLLTSDNFAFGAGFLVIGFTVYLILAAKAVSSGHAMVLAAGTALVLLPSVSNFEWSDGGLKYTRRSETSDLAGQVKKLADDNVQANATIRETTEALRVANERLNKLELVSQSSQGSGGQDSGGKSTPKLEWGPYTKPTFFEDLIKKSDQSIKLSNDNLDALTTFQKHFDAK